MKHFLQYSLIAAIMLTAAPASEETLNELKVLKKMHRELLLRIEALEEKLAKEQSEKPSVATPSKEENPVVAEAEPENKGVLELTSDKTVLGVGGRIQVDSYYGWPEGSHTAGGITLDDNAAGEEGQLGMSARDSRLWVKTRTPSRYGMIRSLIETDFWGSDGTETVSNSHGLRLRHAYVQVGPWTVGQTNSLFNAAVTLDTLYDSLDYTLVRQPLLSYTGEHGSWNYSVSLEQPETTLITQDGTKVTPQDDKLPDIGARVRFYPKWGEAGIAAMIRYITIDQAGLLVNSGDVNTTADDVYTTADDNAWGWGVNGYGSVRISNNDDIRFGATYGKGLGRYFAYNAFTAGSVDANGEISLQEVYGGHLGYRHWWYDSLRSTLAYSYAATNHTGSAANVTKASRSLQANLLWTPASSMLVGIEYARALRELESGEEGEMELLRMTLRYDF